MTKIFVRPGVRITWHGDDIGDGAGEATHDFVYEIGKRAEERAKSNAHVDLGNMQRATGMVHPLNRTLYSRRGRWPPPTVKGTRDDVRKVGDRYITHITSLVNYAFIEEVVRGHAFIAPAVADATKNWKDLAKRSYGKRNLG